ncbi:hypothetical protein GHT06_020374 [Daphnia sinensis]|uniref:Uncharacterized protein n=1 Tax=Daphnia sinensis TaxID=1820382 RepID=A0AAD5KHM8_9CRUS|nr:hypothetical protein GHT06_020374 [Daphnia sinensis]
MPKQRATQDFVGERQQRRQFRPLPRTANEMDINGNGNAAAFMVPPSECVTVINKLKCQYVYKGNLLNEDAVDPIAEPHQVHGAENNLNGHHMVLRITTRHLTDN